MNRADVNQLAPPASYSRRTSVGLRRHTDDVGIACGEAGCGEDDEHSADRNQIGRRYANNQTLQNTQRADAREGTDTETHRYPAHSLSGKSANHTSR